MRPWTAVLVTPLMATASLALADHNGQQVLKENSSPSRPNIVFVLTDDQDLHMNSLDYVPLIKRHLIDRGTLFKKHFCTTAVCCPARVSILTGKLSHNTNVTDVSPPYGMLLSLQPPSFFLLSAHLKADTPSSLPGVTTTTTSPCGFKQQDTIPTTPGNCSTLIMSITTIPLS